MKLSTFLFGFLMTSHAFMAQAQTSEQTNKMEATTAKISPQSERPSTKGDSEHFTGAVSVAPLFTATAPARASAAYVTFEAGAHTAWHTHPLGQTLVVTAGKGYVQFWGAPIQTINVGDVVWIPPNQKHWHGATPNSTMTHLAIQEQENARTADWQEKVSDEQYKGKAVNAVTNATSPIQIKVPTRAQQLMGDIAPKLAELTDTVLLGDVWNRPGLAKRDRSLVTVSALVALNRPEQLRSHMTLAMQNGVTQAELVEAITQLAFYSGWPNAITAIGVAREVFAKP